MISYYILAKLKSYWYHFNCEVGRCSMKTFNPYPLRIDEELMEKLKYIANENSRSVNREIEFAIKKLVKEYEEEKNIDISKVLEKNKETS